MTSHATITGRRRFNAVFMLMPLLCVVAQGISANDETKSCIETAKQGLLEVPEDLAFFEVAAREDPGCLGPY